MTNSSCPLLGLPEDVQAQIVAALHAVGVDGNLRGAQSLLSLRLASKRAACFGHTSVSDLGLEFVLVCRQFLMLLPDLEGLQALVQRASTEDRVALFDPLNTDAIPWLAEVGCLRKQLFRRMLARARVVQAGIAKVWPWMQRLRGSTGWEGNEHLSKLLDSMQHDADLAVALCEPALKAWEEFEAALTQLSRALDRMQATLAVWSAPMQLPECKWLKAGLGQLCCCCLLGTV